MALSDLPFLHEQSCIEAMENQKAVKRLNQESASLKAEVSSLKGYIEAASMRMMEDDESVATRSPGVSSPRSQQQQRSLELEVGKLQAVNADLQAEISRLRKG
jgi:hypothetical protein